MPPPLIYLHNVVCLCGAVRVRRSVYSHTHKHRQTNTNIHLRRPLRFPTSECGLVVARQSVGRSIDRSAFDSANTKKAALPQQKKGKQPPHTYFCPDHPWSRSNPTARPPNLFFPLAHLNCVWMDGVYLFAQSVDR